MNIRTMILTVLYMLSGCASTIDSQRQAALTLQGFENAKAAFSTCVYQSCLKLDDGVTSVETVADIAATSCPNELTNYARAINQRFPAGPYGFTQSMTAAKASGELWARQWILEHRAKTRR